MAWNDRAMQISSAIQMLILAAIALALLKFVHFVIDTLTGSHQAVNDQAVHERNRAVDLIKWIAMVTMVLDHVRFIWPNLMGLFVPGRLAFPLFALAMALNIYRQRSGNYLSAANFRYLTLLLSAALVSEVPYKLAFGAHAVTLNILPTLVLGLLVAWGVHYRTWGSAIIAVLAATTAVLSHTSLNYGLLGVLLPASLLLALRGSTWTLIIPAALCFFMTSGSGRLEGFLALDEYSILVMLTASAAPVFGIWLARQQVRFPVPRVTRWGYLFYPGHLFCLALISVIWGLNR